jgi:hypothetical protein
MEIIDWNKQHKATEENISFYLNFVCNEMTRLIYGFVNIAITSANRIALNMKRAFIPKTHIQKLDVS